MIVRTILIAAVFLLPIPSISSAKQPVTSCPKVEISNELSKLKKTLSANNYTSKQQNFLIKGVTNRANELKPQDLNASGRACGIKNVRAYVVGCLNFMLNREINSVSNLRVSSGTSIWNKANVSRGEALVIGLLHTCRADAMEKLTTIR